MFFSDFVNTIAKYIFFNINQFINFISIFCISIFESINKYMQDKFFLYRIYSFIIFFILLFSFLSTLDHPYPGKSTKYHFLFIKKWFINFVFPGLLETLVMLFFLKLN